MMAEHPVDDQHPTTGSAPVLCPHVTVPPSDTVWACRNRKITIPAEAPLIMGVLNVTPDSFSDGGKFLETAKAVEQALEMITAGASIIDIGGESTRPGSASVAPHEQIRRVLPVIDALLAQKDIPVSIDTTSSLVAQHALNAGACIINDISGLSHDPAMTSVAKASHAGIVIMHMQGTPKTMQTNPEYTNCITEIHQWLQTRINVLEAAGIAKKHIVIDPGIGFGKKLWHNLEILRQLAHFTALGLPVLVGASRKRFIGQIGQAELPADRLPGSLAALACAVMHGASILRVHDVAESVQAAKIAAAIRQPECWVQR
ncbi:MAG: dihydropteroate synthase [Kiritimatiellia bacterium]